MISEVLKYGLSYETFQTVPLLRDETVIIFQRHDKYDEKTGHLTPEGQNDTAERSHKKIQETIIQIPENERPYVSLLVVASPTRTNIGKRSVETANLVIKSVEGIFEKYKISKENIITKKPRPSEYIEAPRILKGDNAYLRFLVERYGKKTKKFWQAYEEDTHEDVRKVMGAEGPIEMSDRFAHFVNVLGRYSHRFHTNHTGEPARLIIWEVSHYDTVATYFKNHVANIDQKEYVPVGYGGGISLVIDSKNNASVTVGETRYPVELTKQGTTLTE